MEIRRGTQLIENGTKQAIIEFVRITLSMFFKGHCRSLIL